MSTQPDAFKREESTSCLLLDYEARLRNAPRVGELAPSFAAIAAGSSGKPVKPVELNAGLLGNDALALEFHSVLQKRSGHFDAHFVASIPYALEEECRIGAALWSYGKRIFQREGRAATVYILSGGDGPVPRTLAECAPGIIKTLTCSPNEENKAQFFDRGAPDGAHFFLGPYFDVTPATLSQLGMTDFAQGFDVVQEDTTFQMYAPERYEQIALARRNLRENGVFVAFEKLRHKNWEEYLRREQQKDTEFKSLYFSPSQINQKRSSILNKMEELQVTLSELSDALQRHFATAVVIGNSGNFYTVAASNSTSNLSDFIKCHIDPAVPPGFCYELLPKVLFSQSNQEFSFRRASHQAFTS